MPPRQIGIDATPYYHHISRYVRRAFLCGHDRSTLRRFDHGKRWIVGKLAALTDDIAIEICPYAVLNNHLHLVLRIDSRSTRIRRAGLGDDHFLSAMGPVEKLRETRLGFVYIHLNRHTETD